MRRFHLFDYTVSEFSDFANQLAVKDKGYYSVDDIVIINEHNDATEDQGEGENLVKGQSARFNGKQIFFTVTGITTATVKNGLKQGYLLLKLKRTKNPADQLDAVLTPASKEA